MPSYPAQGEQLHYDERGTGDPVVVIGGGPARHPDYLGDLGGLSAHRTLLLPHLRGVGSSPFPDDPSLASWWRQAEDVEALRAHLGLKRVVVVGHSAGTRIALAFAARFAPSIERLILITPPAADLIGAPDDVQDIRSRRDEPDFTTALARAQQGPPASADDDRFTIWQQSIAPISYAAWGPAQQEHAAIGRWSTVAVRAYGTVPPPATFRTDLAEVAAPVRVLAGAEDGVTGVTGPLALAALFADGRADVIAGAGHYPWIDRREDFGAVMEAALLH
jgi:pimeloyl-ACP methyl ester carboxylesterase